MLKVITVNPLASAEVDERSDSSMNIHPRIENSDQRRHRKSANEDVPPRQRQDGRVGSRPKQRGHDEYRQRDQ